MKLLELCAGTGAVSLRAMRMPPFPVSRIGSKRGYADAILKRISPYSGFSSATLVENDPDMSRILRALFKRPEDLADEVDAILHSAIDERTVWESCRGLDDPASLLVRMAGARGGIGGFKCAHRLRPYSRVIPASLVKRIQKFSGCVDFCNIYHIHGDAESINPFYFDRGTVVYLDPPYSGRQGYKTKLGMPAEELAQKWASSGFEVYVSEAIPLPGAYQTWDITNERVGQKRRSMTINDREWLSHFRADRTWI